jgi:phosphoribosylglycinamide formyltransferase 1
LITRESQQMFNFAPRMKLQRIALFISGNGSNARNISDFFQNHTQIRVGLILSSAQNPLMNEFCVEQNIPFEVLNHMESDAYLNVCQKHEINWVILAGFLKKIPEAFIEAFPNRIINIHPALLPRFGGKGMYGKHVHEAVSKSTVHFSGITVHLVNEEFDKGMILAQYAFSLKNRSSTEAIESHVRILEMKYFPRVIESVIQAEIIE